MPCAAKGQRNATVGNGLGGPLQYSARIQRALVGVLGEGDRATAPAARLLLPNLLQDDVRQRALLVGLSPGRLPTAVRARLSGRAGRQEWDRGFRDLGVLCLKDVKARSGARPSSRPSLNFP